MCRGFRFLKLGAWFENRTMSTPKRTKGLRVHNRRLLCEPLEDRRLLSVTWTGGGGDNNWHNKNNWSGNATPGASDDVSIDTASAVTVNIQSGDSISVKSLTLAGIDGLSMAGGSLTVSANSTLSGSLTMTGGSLTASGSGITVTASGSTSISAANLYAKSGATLALPNLTSYANPTS